MQHVTGFQHLNHGAGGVVGVLHLEHGLVEVVVEPLAQGFDRTDAGALEGIEHLAFGDLQADDQIFQGLVFAPSLGGHAFQGPAHVIGRLQHLAGKISSGVLGCVDAVPFGAPAHVLGLGKGAQQFVLEVRRLGLKLRQAHFGRGLGRDIARGRTRGRVRRTGGRL